MTYSVDIFNLTPGGQSIYANLSVIISTVRILPALNYRIKTCSIL